MAKVTLTIDGQKITADSNQTILQVARSIGKEIPTLCHDPRLEPFTSCFVCVVEVEGARGFVPSCATKVTDGMVVRTNTEDVLKARKMALELIVSNHFADCLGPCEQTCPAHVDVQGYIALMAMGKYSEAVALIKETNPFPSVCGRICTRPCEGKCRRNITDEPVGIDYLKRYATDLDREKAHPFTPKKKASTGYRVAIVGGGPAGLTAAYYLALEGHNVTVFESREKAGGWLRYGIPEYRLPEDILDYEIESILKIGVELKTNQALGKDFTLEELFDGGYEAVFIGVGAQRSPSLGIEGEGGKGVMAGIEFLEKAYKREIRSLKGQVIVVGGGNTAVDAARTSLRLGADEVIMVYRRSKAEMPAHHLEVEETEKEGVKLQLLTNPVKFNLDQDGKVKSITCVRMKLGEPDASGRRRPVPIEGSEFDIDADWVFLAIGQKPGLEILEGSRYRSEIKTTRWGTLEVDPETMATNISGVFAGGDDVTGAATAIEAIAAGKKAAGSIHHYLTGGVIPHVLRPFISRKENLKSDLSPEDIVCPTKTPRHSIPTLPVEDRLKGFVEVELGYTPEQAEEEIKRCLECGCTAFFECDLQKHCTTYQAEQKNFSGEYHKTNPDTSHPFLRFDMSKCILCGRCVRICEEVVGACALGFVQRGFDAHVMPALEKPLLETTCISCGMCADTCPTGAITVKPDAPKPGPFKLEKTHSVCNFCGTGCGIELETVGDRLIRVSGNKNATVNDGGNLCKGGRFGFRVINSADRLMVPLIRKRGQLQSATWEEAYNLIRMNAEKLIVSGFSQQVAALGGVRLTNEEAYLLQKMARGVLKSNNIYSLSANNKVNPRHFYTSMPNVVYDNLKRADLLIVFGFNPQSAYPVLDFKLQKLTRKEQTEIYYINADRTFLSKRADHVIPLDPSQVEEMVVALLKKTIAKNKGKINLDGIERLEKQLKGLEVKTKLKSIGIKDKDLDEILNKLFAARHLIFVYDLESMSTNAQAYIYDLVQVLKAAGHTVGNLSMVGRSNTRGVLEMGLHPDFLPGWLSTNDFAARRFFESIWRTSLPEEKNISSSKFMENLTAGKIRSMYVLGEDLVGCAGNSELVANALKKLDFLVVHDMFLTPTAELAHVVLPASSFAETNGTMINSERRIQRVNSAISPIAGKTNIEILNDIAVSLGMPLMSDGLDSVWSEMETLIPSLAGISIKELTERGALLKRDFKVDYVVVPETEEETGYEFGFTNDVLVRRWKKYLKQIGVVKG